MRPTSQTPPQLLRAEKLLCCDKLVGHVYTRLGEWEIFTLATANTPLDPFQDI